MNLLKKNLSYQLKKFRHSNGLSQEKAAEQLGISTLFLGELERGKRLPSTSLLIKIYHYIGCTEIPIDNDLSEEKTLPDNSQQLIELIKSNPEVSDTLLIIAKNLLK